MPVTNISLFCKKKNIQFISHIFFFFFSSKNTLNLD